VQHGTFPCVSLLNLCVCDVSLYDAASLQRPFMLDTRHYTRILFQLWSKAQEEEDGRSELDRSYEG
jgi:hypothetical protein